MQTLEAALSASRYPGRGIVIGRSEDGKHAAALYFIMGRSASSRNRVFEAVGDGLRTRACDPSKIERPELVIYSPVRVLGQHTIVTNGDQTDTVYDHLLRGYSFESALRTRAYEPDEPHFTPRVSAIISLSGSAFSYTMALLRRGCGCERFFYEYEAPEAGVGHFIHTYQGDGNPLPAFSGEPERVEVRGTLDEIASRAWEALDADNRVALFARFISLARGTAATRIINQYGEA